MREAIYSKKFQAGHRAYFFDIRKAKSGNKYIEISESRPEGNGKRKSDIVIFEEYLEEFCKLLIEAAFRVQKVK